MRRWPSLNTENLMRYISSVVLSLGIATLAGCGGVDDAPVTVTVTGTVTIDGKPLPTGEIIFRPADGNGRADAASIQDGQYSLECTLGGKAVTITALREVPGVAMQELETGEAGGEVEQYIPEAYNDRTTLTADVTESGDNTFDFPLEAASAD
jgi:hypothetical protein